MRYTQHTSESVSDGHPDKIADQISDAILDEALRQDKNARVACEVLVKSHTVVIAGEISAVASIDYMSIVCKVLTSVYSEEVLPSSVELINRVGEQSAEIASGVDHDGWIGAGDQGIMYGYATDETKGLVPMPIYLSHQLMLAHKQLRKDNPQILADAKSQVTVVYDEGKPVAVSSVVLSTQHTKDLSVDAVRELIREKLIDNVIPKHLVNEKTKYWVNPSGSFVRGGPSADCGLTGRKLMVDTYGGVALHGGGAFSGKDSTKVDRTAAYMARYVAKNIVAAGLARRCEVCLAYAIGVHEPVMVEIDTFGTHTIPENEILDKIKNVFDFTPEGMIAALSLREPIFLQTASFGHFGREDMPFPWERVDQVDALCR